jgi:hypothetical protein
MKWEALFRKTLDAARWWTCSVAMALVTWLAVEDFSDVRIFAALTEWFDIFLNHHLSSHLIQRISIGRNDQLITNGRQSLAERQ